jgi:hypothetical protein
MGAVHPGSIRKVTKPRPRTRRKNQRLIGRTVQVRDNPVAWYGELTRRHTARDANNNHNKSGIASPPPPYYHATREDSWTGYDDDGRQRVQSGRPGETSTSIGRTGGSYSVSQQEYPAVHPGAERGPITRVHRTLQTSSSPRSGGRQTGHDEGGYGRKRTSGLQRDERLAHPTGQKQDGWRSVHEPGATNRHANINTGWHRREPKSVAVARSDGEEYEEGASRLEERVRMRRSLCW